MYVIVHFSLCIEFFHFLQFWCFCAKFNKFFEKCSFEKCSFELWSFFNKFIRLMIYSGYIAQQINLFSQKNMIKKVCVFFYKYFLYMKQRFTVSWVKKEKKNNAKKKTENRMHAIEMFNLHAIILIYQFL